MGIATRMKDRLQRSIPDFGFGGGQGESKSPLAEFCPAMEGVEEMPGGLTGLELANLLLAIKPPLKVLIMSGYSAELARGDLVYSKGFAYLQKPFSTRVLAETVRKCLDAG